MPRSHLERRPVKKLRERQLSVMVIHRIQDTMELSTSVDAHKGRLAAAMALRLEMTFAKPNAAHWLRLQNAYDLWQTRQHSSTIRVLPFEVPAT